MPVSKTIVEQPYEEEVQEFNEKVCDLISVNALISTI